MNFGEHVSKLWFNFEDLSPSFSLDLIIIFGEDIWDYCCFIKYREERPFLMDEVEDVFVTIFLADEKELHFS